MTELARPRDPHGRYLPATVATEVVEAVLLEDIDDVTNDAKAMLKSATFGLTGGHTRARQQAVEDVLHMFAGLVEADTVDIQPDHNMVAIAHLLDTWQDRAALVMLHARWELSLPATRGWAP